MRRFMRVLCVCIWVCVESTPRSKSSSRLLCGTASTALRQRSTKRTALSSAWGKGGRVKLGVPKRGGETRGVRRLQAKLVVDLPAHVPQHPDGL